MSNLSYALSPEVLKCGQALMKYWRVTINIVLFSCQWAWNALCTLLGNNTILPPKVCREPSHKFNFSKTVEVWMVSFECVPCLDRETTTASTARHILNSQCQRPRLVICIRNSHIKITFLKVVCNKRLYRLYRSWIAQHITMSIHTSLPKTCNINFCIA